MNFERYLNEDKIKGIEFPIVFTVNGEPVGVANTRSQYYSLVKKFHIKSTDSTSVDGLKYWYDTSGFEKELKKKVDDFVKARGITND